MVLTGHAPSILVTPLDHALCPKFCPSPVGARLYLYLCLYLYLHLHLHLRLCQALAYPAQERRGAAGVSVRRPRRREERLRVLETPCMEPVFTWRRLQGDLRAPAGA